MSMLDRDQLDLPKRTRLSAPKLSRDIVGLGREHLCALAACLLIALAVMMIPEGDEVYAVGDTMAAQIYGWYYVLFVPKSHDLPFPPNVTGTPAALSEALEPKPPVPAPTLEQNQLPATNSVSQQRAGIPSIAIRKIPIYGALDFLSGYLDNSSWAIIPAGQPWENGSVNVTQLRQPQGGTTYWDYWIESEPWDSPNHMWRDDQGQWHTYQTETVSEASGRKVTAYVLVDRTGPGVMDKLWFTHDAVSAIFGIFTQPDPPAVKDWGNLARLGSLRIEVDENLVYDGPIQDWFSGDAQNLPPELRALFVWRYGDFGSDGNIIPIPYQHHIKVSVYGGTAKPKWFMATGLSLPANSKVKPYVGSLDAADIARMRQLAVNVSAPEKYIDRAAQAATVQLEVKPTSPFRYMASGAGTIEALRFRLAKTYDPRHLRFTVRYGNDTGIDVPLVAFFGEPDQISLHRSTPLGIIDEGDSYLFYSNLPIPYQDGVQLVLATDSDSAIPITMEIVIGAATTSTQLRILLTPPEKLTAMGPDFTVDIDGSGKLVGLVLVTKDQQYDLVPRSRNKDTGKEDADKRIWPMGYLEGNLTVSDAAGNRRYFSGQEDWAEGGYYFKSGFTVPAGGANRPIAGVLRYRQGRNEGYATLFRYFNDASAFPFEGGLHLSFGHGTWRNNFPVTFGATVYYYRTTTPGMDPTVMPSTDNGGSRAP